MSSDHTKTKQELVAELEAARRELIRLKDVDAERKRSEVALRESEENCRSILDNALVGVARTTPSGDRLYVNPYVVQMFGYTSAEEFIKGILDVGMVYVDVADREILLSQLEEHGEVRDMEIHYKKKDGSTFWAEINSRVSRDKGGSLRYLETFFIDITDRKRAEEALRENAEWTRLQRDLAVSLGATSDLEEALRLCLEAAVRVKGIEGVGVYLAEEATGDMTLAHAVGFSSEFLKLAACFPANSPQVILLRQGQPVYSRYSDLPVSKDPVREREGLKAIGIIPVQHEGQLIACLNAASRTRETISDEARNALEAVAAQIGGAIVRIKTEKTLRESRERYRNLFENAPVGIFQSTPAGKYLSVNPECARLYGFSSPEELQESISDIGEQQYVNPADREEAKRLMEEQGEVYGLEYRRKRKDGSTGWASLYAKAVWDGNGQVIYYDGFIVDIDDFRRTREALSESERRFHDLVEFSSDWIWEVDSTGIYTYSSAKIEEILGYNSEEILGKTPFDLMPPEEAERVGEIFENIAQTRQPFHGFENMNLHKAGRVVFLETSGVPIFDDQGRLTGYRGMDRDITERKLAEEELGKTNELLHTVLNNLRAIVFVRDIRGRYMFINPYYENLYGLKNEDIVGNTPYDFLPAETAERLLREDRRIFETGEPLTHEELVPAGDMPHYFLTTKVLLLDAEGNPYAVCGIATDITERKKAEEELRQANELLHSILDNLRAIVFMRDLQGRYVFINSHFERVYGFTQEMMIGKTPIEFLSEETAVQRLQEDQRVLETGESFTQEEMVVVEGQPYHFLSTKMPLYDAKGDPYAICGIAMDITDRKRTERALLESEERNRTLSEMANEAIAFHEKGFLVEANSRYFDLFQYSPEEVLGKSVVEYTVAPQSRDFVRRRIQENIMSTYEATALKKDGSTFQMEVHARNIRYKGKYLRVAIMRDITERKQAEEAVRRERDNLLRILDSMEDGVDIINDQYEVEYANPVLIREFGPFEGKTCHEYFEDRESPCLECASMGVFLGETMRQEACYPKRQKTFDVLITPILNPDGRTARLEIFRDITERKQAEEAVRLERDNLMRILDSMEDGVDIINDQFDIEYANPVHVRQFGPYEGKKCYEYYHDRESICWGCLAGEVFAGATVRAESKNFYKSKDRVYDVISTPFQGFSESGNAMLEIFRDITDRKEMEEELRRSRLDLEQRVQERTKELRRSNQQLRKDIAARKRAEEALRKNQALLNAFIEGLPNQVFAKDARGRYLMTNAYLERYLGKPKEDILGLDDRALLPPETAELLMASDRKIMASGEVHIFEETRTVDGKTESWRNTKVPYRDHTGDVVGVIGIAEDITERKRAEEELRQSEKRLRRLSAQLITTQESERKRIGKELHDSLGQLLTLTKISIEACVQGLESTVPSAQLEPLNRLVPHIGETIVELRRIIMDLRPSVLDDMGILAALKWFCLENESVRSGVPMELFLGVEEQDVREELKIVLFRVAQEAVTNALKHAEPGRIGVGLNRRGGSIVLWVEDDGKGFDSDAAMQPGKTTSGFGLASMRERAEVAGGEFLIRSGPKGTRVEAVFPL